MDAATLAAAIKISTKRAVEQAGTEYPRFGVSGVGKSATKLTRLWTSKELSEPTPGTDKTPCSSPYDAYAPFGRRKCVGNWVMDESGTKAKFNVQAYEGDADFVEDGSMGDYVAIEIEPFYYFEDGDMLGVSEHQFPGWKIHPICVDYDGNIREKTYAPCYQLAKKDGKAVSLPGLFLEGNSYAELWKSTQTYGNADVKTMMMLTPTAYEHYNYLLFTIEYATQDCQSVMRGASGMRFRSGGDDKIVAAPAANQAVISGNQTAGYAVGQTITFTTSAWSSANAYDKHLITALARCDADGTVNASGAYTLITYDGADATASITLNTTFAISLPWITGATGGWAEGVTAVNGHTGSPVSNTSGIYPMRYRWCENLWGNVYSTTHDLADVRVDEGDGQYHLEWYYNADPRKVSVPYNYDASDLTETKGWVKLGVQTTKENYKNGYVSQLGHDDKYPFVRVPTATDGSSESYYCDYAYLVFTAAVRAVRRRGALYDGSCAGLGFFFASGSPASGVWHYGGELFVIQ